MIEVEKKFLLSDEQYELLIKDAIFVSEKVFTDIYFDTINNVLTSKDIWLRTREGKFEIKIPLHTETDRMAEQYEEIDNEQSIREFLSLPGNGKFSDDLFNSGIIPFCSCKTIRKKFKYNLFNLDFDVAHFDDFTYKIGEIELMVSEKDEIETAIDQILFLAREHRLPVHPVRGKICEYIRRKRPEHYKALVDAGVYKTNY